MTVAEGRSLSLRGVEVALGGRCVLGPLDLEVAPATTVAVVGPSGAGKSTLLRVMAGQLSPGRGEVSVLGRQLGRPATRRQLPALVGLMPQRLDLVPQLSVEHNVEAGALGRWGLGRSLAALLLPLHDPAADTALQRVGMAHAQHRRASVLSGGEQQRVAFARLLVQDPEVLLADEPVASLDPARADDLLGLLTDLARERGKTLVASLHSPDLARRHFDRIVGLRDGLVTFDLPAHRLDDELLRVVYRLAPLTSPEVSGVTLSSDTR